MTLVLLLLLHTQAPADTGDTGGAEDTGMHDTGAADDTGASASETGTPPAPDTGTPDVWSAAALAGEAGGFGCDEVRSANASWAAVMLGLLAVIRRSSTCD